MKKILFIITQSEFGGAQRYVYDLARSLGDGFEISIAAGPEGDDETGLLQRLGKIGQKTIHLKYLRRAICPFGDILAFFELKKIIKQERPDIIHLNSTKASILGTLAVKYSSLITHHSSPKLIYTAHGWVFNEPISFLKKKFYLWLEKYTAKFKDKIICVSESARQSAIKYGFPPEKLVTIHNGIDLIEMNFLPKEEAKQKLLAHYSSLTTHHFIIGTIAHLYKTKGLENLIEVAKYCSSKVGEADRIENSSFSTSVRLESDLRSKDKLLFLIIGEGEERPKLGESIKKYGLQNRVILLGQLPNAWQYLKAFDIFVLPSLKEGLPYVILEAMAADLPIVATKVGGIPELITDSENGFLVKPKNPQALAEKIKLLIENESLRKKFSQASQKRLQKFSLERMAKETKKVYQSLM